MLNNGAIQKKFKLKKRKKIRYKNERTVTGIIQNSKVYSGIVR